MFWLPVKGPVYWKHTSFPMFSFLSLSSPFCFSQSALPRALGEDWKLKSLLRVMRVMEWGLPTSPEELAGSHLHAGRGENPGLG